MNASQQHPLHKKAIPFVVLHTGICHTDSRVPGELFNNMAIVQAVNEHLKKDPTNSMLLTTLAEL